MSDKVYDNTNSGALFPAANVKVYRKGKCDIEGQERDYVITETHNNKNGQTYYDLYELVGSVKPNRKKKDEKSPDMIGEFETHTNGVYMIFGHKRRSKKNDMEFTGIGVKKKEERPEAENQNQQDEFEDHPF